ncbi:MFS drug efflux transporter [Exophiala viscosa]|uniref:MFS drug efflux transporter n=1 Tax=Exophiala viscosa TaxID=2486360 RepID=A0AAN6E7K3_9EURO|nr:MFS drug efflux transporter [Exophiala viscosa]KAI1627252.1 MFS drug efflux transporter [Exophiala viscosa]
MHLQPAMTDTAAPIMANPVISDHSDAKRAPTINDKSATSAPSSDLDSTTGSSTNVSGKEDEELPPRKIKGVVWVLVVMAILSSLFFFSLDNTIVAVVQPKIIQQFNALDKLPWLVVAYTLGSVSMVSFWGRLYGLFDAKILYIVCVFLFQAGSALCGAAPNMNVLIVGRTLCGCGGAGMYIGVLSLISAFTTKRERPMYIGMTGLVWGLGTALGPIIGGAFTSSNAGWRWAFYINLVIGGLGAPVYLFLLPSSKPRPNDSSKELWKTLDWVGVVLSIGAFLTGTMAIGFGGVIYPWGSGQVISLFVLSGLFFIAFGLQQSFAWFTTPEQRLFPVQFVLDKDLCILFASIGSGTALIFLPIYFLPLYFQYLHGCNALAAGVKLVPFIVTMIVFVFINGGVMSKTGIYWPWYTVGAALALIGNALLYTIDVDTSDSTIYGFTTLAGIGTGCFVQASFAVAQSMVKPSQVAWATGFITLGQLSAGTISMSISNSLFLNKATDSIMSLLPGFTKDEVMAGISGYGNFFSSIPASKVEAVNEALLKALSQVYILAMVAASLVFVLSLFLKKQKLVFDPAVGGGA